jgi:uncharacterized protein YndB with AHSA1/START domain/DNA-binding transcriptional ArsR family regulator
MDTMDKVFKALADSSRRRLLDRLNAQNGQSLRELCVGLHMARQSVSKHLAVLEAANLVTPVRRGRETLHYLNPVPINDIAERWIHAYDQARVRSLADLKRALEDVPVDKPTFVYTIYINTTPERLWQALTDSTFMHDWWGMSCVSDWQVGSILTWERDGVTITDPAQIVLESDPFRRLAFTWHSYPPELAAIHGFSPEKFAQVARERRSRVAFDITPVGQLVKLTITHDDFDLGSIIAKMVSKGWPQVLSSLKSLLETGQPLPIGSEAARQDRKVAQE